MCCKCLGQGLASSKHQVSVSNVIRINMGGAHPPPSEWGGLTNYLVKVRAPARLT